MLPPIVGRIEAFVLGRSEESFDTLVRDAFSFQRRAIPAIDRLARVQAVADRHSRGWRDIPPVPAGSFAEVPLMAAPAIETFRSSGTTGGQRSIHRHAFPELYRAVIDASFPDFCFDEHLRAAGAPRMLALVPPRDQLEDSSLGFMVDHVLSRFGAVESTYAFGAAGTEVDAATGFADTAITSGNPILVLTTAFALVQWLDALAERGHRLALPAGSVIFETGGTKGRGREISREQLLTLVEHRLGVAPRRVVREYGMTELTSQLYGQALRGGDPDLLTGPRWVRVHVLDPLRLEPLPAGDVGLIAIFDLANVGSALHVVTEDLGVVDQTMDDTGGAAEGIRLLGRAQGADLRGCSLTVEELASDHISSKRFSGEENPGDRDPRDQGPGGQSPGGQSRERDASGRAGT